MKVFYQPVQEMWRLKMQQTVHTGSKVNRFYHSRLSHCMTSNLLAVQNDSQLISIHVFFQRSALLHACMALYWWAFQPFRLEELNIEVSGNLFLMNIYSINLLLPCYLDLLWTFVYFHLFCFILLSNISLFSHQNTKIFSSLEPRLKKRAALAWLPCALHQFLADMHVCCSFLLSLGGSRWIGEIYINIFPFFTFPLDFMMKSVVIISSQHLTVISKSHVLLAFWRTAHMSVCDGWITIILQSAWGEIDTDGHVGGTINLP